MRQRRHERTQRHLPGLVADELSWWRRRLVERHLRRCEQCASERDRQERVAAELAELGEAEDAVVDDATPPDDLLDQLLAQARDPGLRERAAVPARGAVSGARPGLSIALVVTVLAAVAVAGWAGWRLGRAWSAARNHD